MNNATFKDAGTGVPKYRILIVDDHPIIRIGLKAVFKRDKEFDIVGEARNGKEATKKAVELSPDVILMDLRMPEVDGLTACRQIKLIAPQIHVLVLTGYSDDEGIYESIKAGASGCILKDIEPDELVKAIRLVCQGHSFLHSSISKNLLQGFLLPAEQQQGHKTSYGLTARELQVLELMAKGLKNKEIASKLWLSEGTVKTHVHNILHKLNQPDRAQAVIFAYNQGII